MTTPHAIAEGATGPTVRWAQYLLVRRTLSYTQIDGSFGPVTRTAVEQFQRDTQLTVDGTVGPATWAAIGGDGPAPPTLTSGSHGAVVEKLQTLLNEGRGDFAPAGNPVLVTDGQYGPRTTAAVKGIQRQAGLPADGIVGLQTWAIPVHAAGEVVAALCGVPAPGEARPRATARPGRLAGPDSRRSVPQHGALHDQHDGGARYRGEHADQPDERQQSLPHN
jgi:hypothetical protein